MGIMIRKQDTVQAKGALLEEGSERDLIRAPKRALCARRDGQNCEYGRDDDPCRDPSTCVFWCAIAIGGIAKGQQLEEVRASSTYMRMYFGCAGIGLYF